MVNTAPEFGESGKQGHGLEQHAPVMLGVTLSSVGFLRVSVAYRLVNHTSHDPSKHKFETNAVTGWVFCDFEFWQSAQDQCCLQQSFSKICNKSMV